jgi:hypothetical protein
MPAKGNCRLGTIARQWKEPFVSSARKQHSQCVFHVLSLRLYRSLFWMFDANHGMLQINHPGFNVDA